jgi:hypothetical protein
VPCRADIVFARLFDVCAVRVVLLRDEVSRIAGPDRRLDKSMPFGLYHVSIFDGVEFEVTVVNRAAFFARGGRIAHSEERV